MGIRIVRTLFLLLCAGGVIYFPLVFGGGTVIEPGFPGALPTLVFADNAFDLLTGTPLSYDGMDVDSAEMMGWRLPNDGSNCAVGHFVVPPWMPSTIKVRAILRVEHEGGQMLKTALYCHYAQINEEADNHSVAAAYDLGLSPAAYNPTNVATSGMTISGLSVGDIVTCKLWEYVSPAEAFTGRAWFVGFEVYE